MKVKITKQAKKDLSELNKKTRDKIENIIKRLQQGESDFRKLTGKENEWKIKVGDYRVIIEIDKQSGTIFVKRVTLRKDAYRKF